VELQLHEFLILALDGGELSASCPSYFNLWKGGPGTHWIGRWVGLRAGLDAVGKKGIQSWPMLGIEPWLSSLYPSQYTD